MSISKAQKKIPLNVFLLKEKPPTTSGSDWTADEFLSKPLTSSGSFAPIKVDKYDVTAGGNPAQLLIRKPITSATPAWVEFVLPGLSGNSKAVADLKNKSVSALLLLTAKSRQFLVAFGHGRHMIDMAVVEHRFGIRVALNSISPDKIASIDKQTFDATPRISRTQAIRASAISEYGVDAEQDMLRALVGVTRKEFVDSLGTVIAGMDSLKATVGVELGTVEKFLEVALERAASQDYLASKDGRASPFAWVDNLVPVADRALIETLDAELLANLKKRDFQSAWMAAPEIIDWDDFEGFAYTAKDARDGQNLDMVPSISTFVIKNAIYLTIEKLKKLHIYVVRSISSSPISAYKAIYSEISLNGFVHVLHSGSWYQIEKSFEKRVKDFFSKLPRLPFAPPFIEYDHKDEGGYNVAVAAGAPSEYSLLDKKLVQFGGKHSKIELCDLFKSGAKGARGRLVHVKRGRDSSTLSHLFAQGSVAARLMAGEPEFIKAVNGQLKKHGFALLPGVVAGSDFEVIYAIIDGPAGNTLDLPFFSKVNLETNCRDLRILGFDVLLLHIPESAKFLAKAGAKKKAKQAAKKAAKKVSKKAVKKLPSQPAAKVAGTPALPKTPPKARKSAGTAKKPTARPKPSAIPKTSSAVRPATKKTASARPNPTSARKR